MSSSRSESSYVLASVTRAVLSWSHITELAIIEVPLNEALFLHIARLPMLTSAELWIGSNFNVKQSINTHLTEPSLGFKKLSHLKLALQCSTDLDDATYLILSVQSLNLDTYRLDMKGYPTEEAMSLHIRTLADHSSLHSVELIAKPELSHSDLDTKFVMSMNTLRPLLCNPNITSFRMEGFAFKMTDDDAHLMAKSWAQIETLSLIYKDAISRRPGDPGRFSGKTKTPVENVWNHIVPPARSTTEPLTLVIELAKSDGDYLDFADFLSVIMPSVKIVIPEEENRNHPVVVHEMNQKLAMLTQLVKQFADIREEERSFLQEPLEEDQHCPQCYKAGVAEE